MINCNTDLCSECGFFHSEINFIMKKQKTQYPSHMSPESIKMMEDIGSSYDDILSVADNPATKLYDHVFYHLNRDYFDTINTLALDKDLKNQKYTLAQLFVDNGKKVKINGRTIIGHITNADCDAPRIAHVDEKTYISKFKSYGKIRRTLTKGPFKGYDLVAWSTTLEATRYPSPISEFVRAFIIGHKPKEFYGEPSFYFRIEKYNALKTDILPLI